MFRCLNACLHLCSTSSRFWPCPLRGTWYPQLWLQNPRRWPFRQYACFVLVQPWIQSPRQQHTDLSERGQARVEQTASVLHRWVSQDHRGLMSAPWWQIGRCQSYISFFWGNRRFRKRRERSHYNAITHAICVTVALHAHNIQFSFSNNKMTKSSSFSCGTSRIHLNISRVFGRLICCQKANLALAGAWQLLMRVESIMPDYWGDTVIFLLWIVIFFFFFYLWVYFILYFSLRADVQLGILTPYSHFSTDERGTIFTNSPKSCFSINIVRLCMF